MDKLKPILQHRFWILLGLAIPLALWGYYSASGAMKDATETRIKQLDDVEKQVPTGNEANPRYAQGLTVINDGYAKAVQAEQRRLWTEQKSRMDWPASMEAYLPGKYRADFTNNTRAAINYRGEYESNNRGELGPLLKAVYEGFDPVTRTQTGVGIKGRVFVDPRIIPRHTFGQFTIPASKIWDAQEDIWFLRLLVEAVRNINKNSENVANAPIRVISELRLKGGDGQSTAAKSAVAGNFGASSEMAEAYAESASERLSGYDLSGGAGKLGGGRATFDVAQELGSDALAATSTTTDPTAIGPGSDLYAGMSGRAKELLRYVAFEQNAPFRERGFYIGVIIDQSKIPDFLVELSNAPWPIRIVRFQVGPNPHSTSGPRVGPSRFGGPFAMSGMGGDFLSGGGEPAGAEYYSNYSTYADEPATSSAEYTIDGAATPYPGGAYPGATAGPPMLGAGGANDPLAKTLDHPDLVELYVCGVITFYNPPAEEAAPASNEPPTEQVAPTEAPTSPPAETTTAPEEGATPAGDATAPATESAVPVPATSSDPNAPTTPAAPVPADPSSPATDAPPTVPAPEGNTPAPAESAPGAATGT